VLNISGLKRKSEKSYDCVKQNRTSGMEDSTVDLTSQSRKKPFQFSLRNLLEFTSGCCLLSAIWAWGGEPISRSPEWFLGLGIILLVVGYFYRRLVIVCFGFLVLVGVWFGLQFYVVHEGSEDRTISAQGLWQKQRIVIGIKDAKTNAPIAGAKVKITINSSFMHSISQKTTNNIGMVILYGIVNYEIFPSVQSLEDNLLEVDIPGQEKISTTLAKVRNIHWNSGDIVFHDDIKIEMDLERFSNMPRD
jgi:hypothetical protein